MNDLRPDNLPREAEASERPLVALFLAPECRESRQLAQTLNDFAQDYQGRLDFVRIDITQAGELAKRFQVHSTPTLVVLLNGVVLYQAIGALPGREVASAFESVLRSEAVPTVVPRRRSA